MTFSKLPPAVAGEIVRHMTYDSRIRLMSTSKSSYQIVQNIIDQWSSVTIKCDNGTQLLDSVMRIAECPIDIVKCIDIRAVLGNDIASRKGLHRLTRFMMNQTRTTCVRLDFAMDMTASIRNLNLVRTLLALVHQIRRDRDCVFALRGVACEAAFGPGNFDFTIYETGCFFEVGTFASGVSAKRLHFECDHANGSIMFTCDPPTIKAKNLIKRDASCLLLYGQDDEWNGAFTCSIEAASKTDMNGRNTVKHLISNPPWTDLEQ